MRQAQQGAGDSRPAGDEAIEQAITAGLERLARLAYGVDVREKYKTSNPVIATVVDYNAAMHELLFIRHVLKSGTISADPLPSRPAGGSEQDQVTRVDAMGNSTDSPGPAPP